VKSNGEREITFRADASLDLGIGHVMRCLTLADALVRTGTRCRFVSGSQRGNLNDLIRAKGHAVCEVSDLSGDDWAADAEFTLAAARDSDWLVVDHYGLDYRWERHLQAGVGKLMAIDDLANRRHACDLLLDQTLGRAVSDYDGLTPPSCRFLLGPGYALLRPRFSELRERTLARREHSRIEEILVAMGGVDRPNVTGRILSQLDGQVDSGIRVTAVLGGGSMHVEAVRSLAVRAEPRVRVLVGVDDMAQLMADADLAIGAGGSSAWERCCMGLPSIVVPIADNQTLVAKALQSAGAAMVMDPSDLDTSRLAGEVARLSADVSALQAMSVAAAAITDGTGVQATIHAMDELQ
jgi:UDP-2,4-diacetamido-2,4,6-trideoxy-beta-L-altropyranose hydrolase